MTSPFLDIGLDLGESDAAGEFAQWAGRKYTAMDRYAGANAGSGPKLRTTLLKEVMLVKNSSGVSLLPGMAVTPKAGTNLKEVDGYTRLTAADGKLCLVVDEHYATSGVPNGDYFFVTVSGPTEVITSKSADAGNVIPEGEAIVAETAAASTHSTTAGRVEVADYTGATAPLAKQIQGAFATALSAKTTANTDARLLVNMKSRWF